MEFVETIRRLELIIEHSNRLNTLVNKKWYDEQSEMLREVDGILYQAGTLKSLMKVEENATKIRNSLYKLCDSFTCCASCPLFDKTKVCLVKDEHHVERLDAEQLAYLYDKMKAWVESFLIE